MSLLVYTWGTGAAYGRELGLAPNRKMRNQAANSIIGFNEKIDFHFLVDAGAPCVESIIQKNILKVPDVLFITHSHNDHISDLDKLVHSRIRGLDIQGNPLKPLSIICTKTCLNHPEYGLKKKFKDINKKYLNWNPVPTYDEWYSVNKSNGKIIPSRQIKNHQYFLPIEFKVLPVNHTENAPGACLYIFQDKTTNKKIIITGDFHLLDDNIINNKDFKDPSLIILETNNIKANETDHTNWDNNKEIINRFKTDISKTLVLLTHIAGYEDYKQGYYDHIPTDKDWAVEIDNFKPPENTTVEIAEDGKSYEV